MYRSELEYQTRQLKALDAFTILHICGNVSAIVEWMGQTGPDVLSIEPKTSPRLAREKCGPDVILMGGVDTATTLFSGDTATVEAGCKEMIEEGIQILAPGCAVAPSMPLENLKTMVAVARAN